MWSGLSRILRAQRTKICLRNLLKGAYEKYLARPERLELPTLWFEARCSIQLSYGRYYSLYLLKGGRDRGAGGGKDGGHLGLRE